MKIGYIRVSTEQQNTIRQEILMKELEVEKIFIDKISGKNTKRPQLMSLLSFVREGDQVIVESISRFARNTKDLLELIDQLNKKNVKFISKKESIDTETITGKFMLTVFGAMAELERAYILDRQKEGIQEAKRQGKYKGRKLIEIDSTKFKELYHKWKSGKIKSIDFMKAVNLKPNTFYRRIKNFEKQLKQ